MPLIRKDAPSARPTKLNDALKALVAGSADERWAAARALGDVPGGAEALGQALWSEVDPRVREAAFTALARAGTPASVDAIIPHLRSDDAQRRTAALDALKAMPTVAGGGLVALLNDPDPDVRLLSCEIARSAFSDQAADLLSELLDRDADANVCAAAVEVLGEVGGASAIPSLSRCAARFPHDPFLGFAIKVAIERLGSRPTPSFD